MADTVLVAFIAVGGTLGSGVLSYLAARGNTRAQLGTIEADMARLKVSHAEEYRQERAAAYETFLASAFDLEDFARGMSGPFDAATFTEGVKPLTNTGQRILILGTEEVQGAIKVLIAAIGDFGQCVLNTLQEEQKNPTSRSPDEVMEAAREAATKDAGQPWWNAKALVIKAMRDDVNRAKST